MVFAIVFVSTAPRLSAPSSMPAPGAEYNRNGTAALQKWKSSILKNMFELYTASEKAVYHSDVGQETSIARCGTSVK